MWYTLYQEGCHMSRPRTGQVIQCSECGTEMYLAPKEVGRRKHCSRACQSVAIERRRRTECAKCGTQFGQSPSIGGKYCSYECYQAGRLKRTDCAVCQKPLTEKQAIYCSHECRDTGRRTLENLPCEVCGTMMKVQPYQFGKRRACSWACSNELKRGMQDGPGAKFKRSDGYIAVYYPKHPHATQNHHILEHRLVMEQKLGRLLLPTEQVNHINHIRDDNRPENLELMTPGDHARESNAFGKAKRQTMRDRLAAYEAKYGPLVE